MNRTTKKAKAGIPLFIRDVVFKLNVKFQCVMLLLVSIAVYAASVGTLTLNTQDCDDAGLGFEFVGIGFISGNEFFDDSPISSVYRCIALTTSETLNNVEESAANVSAAATRYQSFALQNQIAAGMARLLSAGDSNIVDSGNKMAASSDINSLLPDGAWLTTNITEISDDTSTQTDIDIYQVVAGTDKIIGDFILGSALTYVHNESEQGNTHSTGDTVGIAPYLAFKITDFMFASTYLAYNYTHTNAVANGSDIDTNEFLSETNINFFKVIDSFILKGRGGFRYKHTHTSLEQDVIGRDDDFDELSWIGDIEFGYQFSKKLRFYTGFLYEYRDQEISGASALIHDGVGFMRYGTQYSINKDLSLGALIEHDINDEDNDFISGGLNARLVF